MGLALDELDNTKDRVVHSNGIDVVCDERVWSYVRHYAGLAIDFTRNQYGAGFILDTGGSCGSSCTEC